MKIMVSVVLASMIALSGCTPAEKVSEHTDTFTIVGVKRPKHFYVDLKDSKGIMHKHVYVSKHCNSWQEVQIGSQVTLLVVTYKNEDGLFDKIEARSVCPKS